MPLTQPRDTKQRSGVDFSFPVAAAKKIFAGAIVATDASGNATPGATATTLKAAGRAEQTVDNLLGAAGDVSVSVKKGVFKYKNSSADPIARADIKGTCYIVDDETVAKTNGGNTRSAAGTIEDIDTDGVWVRFT